MTATGRMADLLAAVFRDSPAELAFERACEACIDALPVTGAAISVMTDTTIWQTMGASDEAAAGLEDMQFSLGTGPCLEAYKSGGPVLVSDLTDPAWGTGWPTFSARAAELGIQAVFAFPLQLGTVRPGVLGLYRDRAGPMSPDAVSEALLAADMLCLALFGRLREQESTDQQVVATLWADHLALGRAEVHQATGMIMARLGVSSQEALVRLRGFAFSQGLLLTDVAAGVVARSIVLDVD